MAVYDIISSGLFLSYVALSYLILYHIKSYHTSSYHIDIILYHMILCDITLVLHFVLARYVLFGCNTLVYITSYGYTLQNLLSYSL